MTDPAGADRFMEAMSRRYACKRYNPDTPLAEDEISYILECGRLSPSSFGIEPWEFVVLESRDAILRLGSACGGQDAVLTAPLAVVILVHPEEDYEPDSAFIKARAGRFPGGHPVFRADYVGYWRFLRDAGRVMAWARSQAYIACADMMTGAAAAGIDSCAIEGFDEGAVLRVTGDDPAARSVALVAVFGHRDEEVRPRIREDIGSIARFA